jgi:hypothetical protein
LVEQYFTLLTHKFAFFGSLSVGKILS